MVVSYPCHGPLVPALYLPQCFLFVFGVFRAIGAGTIRASSSSIVSTVDPRLACILRLWSHHVLFGSGKCLSASAVVGPGHDESWPFLMAAVHVSCVGKPATAW
jgi:hypothetical protein